MVESVLRLAEENDIYLIIVLNNHGKFGMTYDTEWARNPYNKELGGFLDKSQETASAAAKAAVETRAAIHAVATAIIFFMDFSLF